MRPGLNPDEMRKLVAAVNERMENGAPFETAFKLAKKVFPAVDPDAIETGFKTWCAKQLGVELEAAPPADPPPPDEPSAEPVEEEHEERKRKGKR